MTNIQKTKWVIIAIIAALFVISLTIPGKAQSLRLGVRAGATLGKKHNPISPSHYGERYTHGYTFGITADFPISKGLSLQSELNYIQKPYLNRVSYLLSDSTAAGNDEYLYFIENRATYNYIEMPLLLKYTLRKGKKFLYINAGPSIGYGLNRKREINWWTEGRTAEVYYNPFRSERNMYSEHRRMKESSEEHNLKDYYLRLIDYSAQFGGGFGVQVGPGSLVLDIRRSFSMREVFKGYGKFRDYSFTLGYSIGI